MKRALAFVLLVSAPAFCQQTNTADPCAQAHAHLEEWFLDQNLPGLQGAVLADGRLVCSVAIGYADLEQQVAVTEITRFRIGSISKTLTSAALGLLVEDERLDLDAPVQRYVPSFPEKTHPITTRQLAGHLSGMPHYGPQDFINTKHYSDVIAALDKFKDRELLFEPGERFAYSSFGWNLISAVLQEAAGVEFLELMQTRVFSPLDMPHTLADQYAQLIPHRTSFYEVWPNGKTVNATAIDNSDVWAGGGFLSTSEDLVRFADGLAAGLLLRPETVELLFEPQVTNDGVPTDYGLGWRSGDHEGRSWVGHGGSHVGASANLVLFRSERLAVALVTSANSRGISDQVMEIADLFLPEP